MDFTSIENLCSIFTLTISKENKLTFNNKEMHITFHNSKYITSTKKHTAWWALRNSFKPKTDQNT